MPRAPRPRAGEELLARGHKGAEYDAWLIKIGEGEQFGSGFVAANPNSKIPALIDHDATNASLPAGMELAYDGLRIPLSSIGL